VTGWLIECVFKQHVFHQAISQKYNRSELAGVDVHFIVFSECLKELSKNHIATFLWCKCPRNVYKSVICILF